MRIAVASGKGGTGKTLVSVNLSAVAGLDLADLDVEEPNAFLYFGDGPSTIVPVSRPVPSIDRSACDLCGECARVCAFNALVRLPQRIRVHEELCHGCGACVRLCPRQAIEEAGHEMGALVSMAQNGRRLVYGRLDVGEANAVPLIKAVRSSLEPGRTTIMDCPPGTSCNMVEAVRGSDYAIMVTEPTPFGAHDLSLALDVLERLGVPHGVVINKAGMGGVDIAAMCASRGAAVLGSIPFRRDIAERHAMGQLLIDRPEDRRTFRDLWGAVMRRMRS
jgi:MinD superfamily P-loop ATPase